MEKTKKIHYGWYILAACFLLNMTVHTMVMQMGSLYTVPMYQDLQVPRTLLALQKPDYLPRNLSMVRFYRRLP